jgi:hypothetical protein
MVFREPQYDGQNRALLNISEIVPELLPRFEIDRVHPKRYKLQPGWLVLQKGLDLKLKICNLGIRCFRSVNASSSKGSHMISIIDTARDIESLSYKVFYFGGETFLPWPR